PSGSTKSLNWHKRLTAREWMLTISCTLSALKSNTKYCVIRPVTLSQVRRHILSIRGLKYSVESPFRRNLSQVSASGIALSIPQLRHQRPGSGVTLIPQNRAICEGRTPNCGAAQSQTPNSHTFLKDY